MKDRNRYYHRGLWNALWLSALLGLTTTAYAQNEFKLQANDAADGDAFGIAVSVDGGRAAVGAYQDDNTTGAVYLYRTTQTRWTQDAKLIADDPSAAGQFGVSVSLSGERVLVGANLHDLSLIHI